MSDVRAPTSATAAVTETVRERILNGTYEPGSHLVERRVAESLGVSHIAVREAFTQLDGEGLVERIPRRGTFVTQLSEDSIKDLNRVRIVLEQLAATLVSERWDDAASRRMKEILDDMSTAAREGDAMAFYDADQRFHLAFWELSGSEILLRIARLLRMQIGVFLRAATLQRTPAQLVEGAEMHQEWISSIERGDLEAATRAIHDNIQEVADQITEGMAH